MTPNSRSALSRKKVQSGLVLFTLLTLFSLILSACGGDSGNKAANKSTLTIGAQSYDVVQAAFNPYNPQPNKGVFGLVYETLYFANRITGEYTPWLASSYQWSPDNTELTFTIRPNVKWSDGKDFTADDVVYTFNTIKQYKASGTDLQGVWSYLKDVSSSDANTVKMTFTQAYPPAFYNIAQTYIIPKHIFGDKGDPSKYTPDTPVGTGPYTLKKYDTALSVFQKNTSYWQADKLHVDEVRFPVYKDNDAFKLALPKGQIDWAGYFQADLKTAFVDKDPTNNHYWMAPINIFTLNVNQQNPLLSQVAVRQAINAALDRTALSEQGESGLAGPANATGLILPNAKQYLDPAYANLSNAPDKAKAEKFLTDAGYTKGTDGIYQKDGKRLSFVLRTVQPYSDWEVMAQIIKGNLKDVGIEISKLDEMSEDAYYPSRTDGKFDLMIGGMVGGPNPYYMYNQYLNSANIGVTNFSQWKDPQTDALLKQFASTTDPAVQKQAIQGLEKIYVEQLPTIPLVTGPDWFEYRTNAFTGWPTESNPYASGSPNIGSDLAVVILHLTPVK
ncbi:ABC transporter substrate-binding protein [Tengunoibacter tsumagoiensis]|uniref:Peptide ABC transporter substrate-binding protein n=1 Tax=Tengunoibacter tsumagoiensis TaxID=2014871 RepID=A0A402A6S7_9CHLR|nr:ABC transporter substrate-binding protein [Tengunoibacter tsumagoiensis]GCE14725.1 peptide ABC transporter substrate-binding protein [Tengunoibacter tsumagoiensis]